MGSETKYENLLQTYDASSIPYITRISMSQLSEYKLPGPYIGPLLEQEDENTLFKTKRLSCPPPEEEEVPVLPKVSQESQPGTFNIEEDINYEENKITAAHRTSYESFTSYCDYFMQAAHSFEAIREKDIFKMEFAYVQEWFLRSSWTEKYYFLSLLVEETSNIGFLKNMLKLLRAGNGKDLIYSTNQNINAFYYDILPEDDNRAMDYATLVKVQAEARSWFAGLNDCQKSEVLLGLVALGGGALLRQLYLHAASLCTQKQKDERERMTEIEAESELKTQPLPEAQPTDIESHVSDISDTEASANTSAKSKKSKKKGKQNKSDTEASSDTLAQSEKSEKKGKNKKGKGKGKRAKEEEKETSKETVTLFAAHYPTGDNETDQLLKEALDNLKEKMAESRLEFGLDENLNPIDQSKPKAEDGKKGNKNKGAGKKKGKGKDKNKIEVLDEVNS